MSSKINAFPDNKNLVYVKTHSESQRVMCWRPILEEFGPTIQHIAGVEEIIDDTLSRLTSAYINKYKTIIMKAHCCANELFTISGAEKKQ